jgi:predicted dienelactone hydrolase
MAGLKLAMLILTVVAMVYSGVPTPVLAGGHGYSGEAGPFTVKTLYQEWADSSRSRILPVKIYYPTGVKGPFPVILFSHGLGGSREAGEFWGSHWAGYGYVSVHIQHPGSDSSIWKNSSPSTVKRDAQEAANGSNLVARVKDVSFAITRLTRLNNEEPLKGKLDLTKIGMSGHSFGGATTMAIAGQRYGAAKEISAADSHVKAAIAFSAPARKGDAADTYGTITIPVMVITGTKDDSPINDTRAEERRIPFDGMKKPSKFLVIFKDGDHMVFGGRARRRGEGGADAFITKEVKMASLAFWDVYLKNDRSALTWLSGGGFASSLGKGGTFEQKQ